MRILMTFLAAVVVAGCAGEKFDINSLPERDLNTTIGDTVYIQQYPNWIGFNRPQDLIVGNEPFAYVADTESDRVVMLDLAGRVIGASQRIKRPVALAQDKRLQLLVCAEFDTLLPGHTQPVTFGAVYRLDLPAYRHEIGTIPPKRVYFDPTDSTRRFTGVATLYNNQYAIARIGPKRFFPYFDNAVLLFDKDDGFISPITTTFSPDGTGLLSIHRLTALATLPTGRSLEYVFAQVEHAPDAVNKPLFKVQWIRLVAIGQTTEFVSKFNPSTEGDIGLLQINRFGRPEGLTLDPSGNLFVIDAEKDSLFRFSSRGVESYSFGGRGNGDRQFNQPSGVAFFDGTVYVADTGNNRIVRFKLSTDLR